MAAQIIEAIAFGGGIEIEEWPDWIATLSPSGRKCTEKT